MSSSRLSNPATMPAPSNYYTEDATMQENAAPPRVGRDTLVAHERAALARMSHVDSKCVSSVVFHDPTKVTDGVV